MEFDSTGNFLASGGKGGRVVLFERNKSVLLSYDRKKDVNTSSLLNFKVMSLNLIT